MKAVMMSIQPKWCELIASGKKTVEVRKTRPKLEMPFKCYIYCTANKNGVKDLLEIHGNDGKIYKANGKIIGEFVCDTYIVDKTFGYDPLMYAAACMSESDVAWYCTSKEMYGWHISDLVIYDIPRELSEFRLPCTPECDGYCEYGCVRVLKRPPQSWCYVEELR